MDVNPKLKLFNYDRSEFSGHKMCKNNICCSNVNVTLPFARDKLENDGLHEEVEYKNNLWLSESPTIDYDYYYDYPCS